MTARRALVTGATGFIGQRLVAHLAARGDAVTCLVRGTSEPATQRALKALGASIAPGDITDPASLRAPFAGADVVYHLASLLKVPWKPAFFTVNEQGTTNVAKACAAAPSPPVLVIVSSLAAVGPSNPARPRTEHDAPAPVSTYGRVKLAAERAARQLADRVPLTIARPPMVFGEGDRGTRGLFRLAARGLALVPRGPEQRVALIHVDDLAAGLAAAGERGARVPAAETRFDGGDGVYFFADEALPTTAELGRRMAAAFDRPCRVVRMPRTALWLAAAAGEAVGRIRDRPAPLNLDKAREITAGSWICDTHRARRELGWSTADLDERLRQTARWYQQAGWP